MECPQKLWPVQAGQPPTNQWTSPGGPRSNPIPGVQQPINDIYIMIVHETTPRFFSVKFLEVKLTRLLESGITKSVLLVTTQPVFELWLGIASPKERSKMIRYQKIHLL